MTTAIGYVVFGIDLNQSYYEEFHNTNWFEELVECEAVETRYSGNGETPHWLGAQLASISEHNTVDFDKLLKKCEVGEAHHAAVAMAIKNISDNYPDVPEHFVDLLLKDKPARFITWGSS